MKLELINYQKIDTSHNFQYILEKTGINMEMMRIMDCLRKGCNQNKHLVPLYFKCVILNLEFLVVHREFHNQ